MTSARNIPKYSTTEFVCFSFHVRCRWPSWVHNANVIFDEAQLYRPRIGQVRLRFEQLEVPKLRQGVGMTPYSHQSLTLTTADGNGQISKVIIQKRWQHLLRLNMSFQEARLVNDRAESYSLERYSPYKQIPNISFRFQALFCYSGSSQVADHATQLDLSGCPWRCPAVPTAVHIDRRHPVLTKTAVFFIRRSTRSCCQTAYYWTSRLPCRRRSHNDLPVDVTSAPSLLTFRKRLKLHRFGLSYPGLVL